MVLASFPAGDPLSLGRADEAADRHRAQGLDCLVVHDIPSDDFQVVTTELPAPQ